jgi:hypothetical protein
MINTLLLAAAIAIAPSPATTENLIRGDAVQGLMSRLDKGEVHLIVDPKLNGQRVVLKVVVLNLSGAPQEFGPGAVTASLGALPLVLMRREAVLAEQSGRGNQSDETAQAHAAAAMPTNGAGQTDVSGFTGGMASSTAGVPVSSMSRTQRRPDGAADARLQAVLLKPMTIAAKAADGGQIVTEKLKRGHPAEMIVAVTFAGETHHFAVQVPH